jgi:DNA-binding transcriptional MerR regulator
MFRIGEFSRIARVSGRLLRYYASIGLLAPKRIDPATGYRYYGADQLGDLNRILALKELGFSLEQVARMLGDKVSAGEIRGMLALKKAELERTLHAEESRLRHVESRLQQIEEEGALSGYDVIVKQIEPQPFLSVRRTFTGMADAVAMLHDVARTVGRRVPAAVRGPITVVAYSDFEEEALDLEVGVALAKPYARPVKLDEGGPMAVSELPGIETMATLVRRGPNYQSHLAFGALGRWMAANSYGIAGPSREVFLEEPFLRPKDDDVVMEIQFPVVKRTTPPD